VKEAATSYEIIVTVKSPFDDSQLWP